MIEGLEGLEGLKPDERDALKKMLLRVKLRDQARERMRRYRKRHKAESGPRERHVKAGSHAEVTHSAAVDVSAYPQLVAALNAKRIRLGWSMNELDARCGFHTGYVAHLFSPDSKTGKSLGRMSLPVLVETLGLRLLAVDR